MYLGFGNVLGSAATAPATSSGFLGSGNDMRSWVVVLVVWSRALEVALLQVFARVGLNLWASTLAFALKQ